MQAKARGGGLMARMQQLPLGPGAKLSEDDSPAALHNRRGSHAEASMSPFGAGPAQAAEEASKPAFPGLANGVRPQGAPKVQHSHLRYETFLLVSACIVWEEG